MIKIKRDGTVEVIADGILFVFTDEEYQRAIARGDMVLRSRKINKKAVNNGENKVDKAGILG